MRANRIITLVVAVLVSGATHADQLVFGSFRAPENAANWAKKLSAIFSQPVSVSPYLRQAVPMYRVHSADLSDKDLQILAHLADAADVRHWRLAASSVVIAEVPSRTPRSPLAQITQVTQVSKATDTQPKAASMEWDLGLQTRVFADSGADGQDQFEGSASFQLEYFRAWDNDTRSVTFSPFLRVDSADDERTHGDIRELFYSRIGDNWDLHVGARRVFWGVTEFNHLVDIINQTDLVENIDGEDKLGQPMVQLSLVRDWGIIDLFALSGFRERTFPGSEGRVRLPYHIAGDPTYESGAERKRVDAAVRWSHYMGPIEIGVHHFSGTSRDPFLVPETGTGGAVILRPYYPVIDQTGIDAQAFYGDWAFKFEGFTRSGYGDRYIAANAGFERTLVGVLGSQADFGIVLEYMFDERDEEAVNTLFEHDIALGGRLQLNDFADTQALLGLIFDTKNHDYFISLEASRRLSDSWFLSLESRIFTGGENLRSTTQLTDLLEPEHKTIWLQDEDYLQLEFKKFL